MQINLLPDLVLARRKEAQVKRIATMSLIGWFGVLLLVILVSFGYSQFEAARLTSANKAFVALDAKVNSPENKAFRKEAQEVQASLKALDQLFNHQQKMSLVDGRLAQLTPKEVQLHSISIGTTGKVELSGTANSYADAGKLIVSLKNSQKSATSNPVYFNSVVLNGANLGDNNIAFNITANLVYPDSGVKK